MAWNMPGTLPMSHQKIKHYMALASKRLGRFTADDGVDASLIGQLKFQVVDIPVHDFTGILLIIVLSINLTLIKVASCILMMMKSTKRFFKTKTKIVKGQDHPARLAAMNPKIYAVKKCLHCME